MPKALQTLNHLIDEIAYRVVLVALGGFGCVLLTSLLYLAKSALGIDLMDGPSPLHEYFLD